MEAYKVWTTLELKGNALKKMQQFLGITKKVAGEFSKLARNLSPLNAQFEKMAASFKMLNPEFSKFSTTLIRINSNAANTGRSISGLNSSVASSANRMSTASAKAAKLAASLNAVAVNGGLAARSMIGVRGAGVGKSAGWGLMGLGKTTAGLEIVGTITKGFKAGNTYQKELGLLTAQNIPGLDKAAIEKFVNSTQIKGASKIDILEALADAAVITKGSSEAFGVAPALAKMKLVGSGFGKEGFNMTAKQLQAAIKTAEIVSGSRDPAVLNKHLGMMTQSWVSTGGRVEPTQYQSIVRSSRGYAKGLNPDFFYYMLEPMIQEFGTRTGPMIAQFFQHMKVGRLTTQGAQILGKMGLVNPNAIQYNKIGTIKGISPNGIKGMDVAGKDIFQWIDKFLVPALDRAGYKSDEQRSGVLGKIFTNSDLTLVQTYLQQKSKFQVAGGVNANTDPMSKMLNSLDDKHAGAMQVFAASFSNFTLSLDKVVGPGLDNALKGLSEIFNLISRILSTTGDTLSEFRKPIFKNMPSFDLSSPPASNNAPLIGHVYLDSDKVGKAVFSKAGSSMQTYVQHGTSGINTTSSPFYPGTNNLGWQGS
jgi:hypothetical protein